MDPFLFSRKQRILQREERALKNLEREQVKTFKEINGTLEFTKKRLERRREWLKGLEEALAIEMESLQTLQAELESLLDETIADANMAKERVEKEYQVLSQELDQMETEEQLAAEQEQEEEIDIIEPEDRRFFVRSTPADSPYVIPASEVKVQWYHPGQQGFSL